MEDRKKRRPPPAPEFVLRGHTAPVYCCGFSPDGKTLASGAGDSALVLWETETTHRCVARFNGAHGDKAINSVRFVGRDRLWSQGRDGFVKQWDLEQQVCLSAHDVGCHGFVPMSLCVAEGSGEIFAALPDGSDMKSVLLLSLDGRERHVRVTEHWKGRDSDGMCMKLCVSQRLSGRLQVFCGYESGQIALRESGKEERFFGLPGSVAMPLTAITVDGASGAGCVGGSESSLFPFVADEEGEIVFGDTVHALPSKGVNDVALRPDGKVFVSAGWDGKVRCFAAKKNPRPVCVCDFHSEPVNCVSFRPSSKVFAAGSNDGKISLWNVL